MIVWFVVYDAATGVIKRWGTCPVSMVGIQSDVGEGALKSLARVTSETHYVDVSNASAPVLRAK